MIQPTKAELIDLFWRVVWTAIPAFLAHFTIQGGHTEPDLEKAGTAAGTAALAAAIGVVTVYARQKLPGTGINVNQNGGGPK